MRRAGQSRPAPELGAWYALTGAVLCAGLTAGLVSPVWAAEEPGDEAGQVELGSFALGDGLDGTIGELDGSFGFTLAAGGLQLAWDSRAAAADPVRLGPGWSFGLASIRVTGGVWVYPASGGAFPMDATSPTGLAGYSRADVSFEAASPGAVVPARADGSVGETPYAYVLYELGGVATYFDAAGHPVAKLVDAGDRVDWRWEPGDTGRLLSVVGVDGTVTALDWSDPSRLVITPATNVTDPAEGSGGGGRWEVRFDDGRVSSVTDPVGLQTRVAYTLEGLVERVTTPAGASTAVQWQPSPDGLARVDRVRLVDDATGAELSVRQWEAQGHVAASGWPVIGDAVAVGGAGVTAVPDPALEYETSLSDGKTRVTSEVDAERRLTARAVTVTSKSGERVIHQQGFEYPETAGAPGATPSAGMQPTAVTTTQHDQHGATRADTESYEFDELGRMVSRTTTDGATTRRVYDDHVPAGRSLPIGLILEETTTARDGLVSSTRSELNEARFAAVATEQWSGREGEELTRVGRVERDIEHGIVTEKRVFPGGDPSATPIVTRWSEQLGLARGTKTVAQTVAAGTAIESTTSSVSSLVHGGVLSETDAVGNVASARYDQAGRQISTEDATGRRVTQEYRTRQSDGVNAVTVATPSGLTVTETRDVLGRTVQKADNVAASGQAVAGHERVFETREHELGVERVTDAWGATTTTEHDVYGRVQRVTMPNGVVHLAEHDDVAGTLTSGVSLTGELADAELTSTTTRDPAGRTTTGTGTRADGVQVPETTTEFDGLGRQVTSTTGERRSTIEYDVRGNATATTVGPVDGAEEDGVTAERRYDAFGVSVEKTLRAGSETSAGPRRELDELGRVVSQTDQRGTTERTSYTPDGLVARVESGTGRVATYEYDPTSRAVIASRVSSPHAATVETAYRYDEHGRLIAVFDPADETGTRIGYEHDDLGNVKRVTYPDGTEIRHESDPHGRKTATIDAAGNRTAYTYDATDGSVLTATQTDRDGAPLGAVRYGHDGFGRVNLLERENGVRTEYTFTSASEIATEVTTGPGGVQAEREYSYGPTGHLISRIDRVADDTGQLRATRTDYEYDALDRLVRSSVRDGDAPDAPETTRTEYEPTVNGDLASETVTTAPGTPEATSTTRRFEYSEVGELTAITTGDERQVQEFDAEGGLIASVTGARFEYDAAGRQIAQTTVDGVQIATRYWADGSRREHSTESGSTRYYWDGDRLLNDVHETAAGAHGTASYLIGTTRHARSIRPESGTPSTSYYGTDRHGNVTDLTDEAGAVTTSYAYTDYGVASATGEPPATMPGGIGELAYNPFQYAGEYTYHDGTQPLGPRTYDPMQARFHTEDDAALANLYAFVDLNPITNVDPTGRMGEQDKLHIGLAIAGLAASVFGAGMLFWAGGALLTGLGAASMFTAGGDVVFAAMEVWNAVSDVKFMDPKATEIASWSIFAAGLGIGFGGALAKAGKHFSRAEKAAESAPPSNRASLDGDGDGGYEATITHVDGTKTRIDPDGMPTSTDGTGVANGKLNGTDGGGQDTGIEQVIEPDPGAEVISKKELRAQIWKLTSMERLSHAALIRIDVKSIETFAFTNSDITDSVISAAEDIESATLATKAAMTKGYDLSSTNIANSLKLAQATHSGVQGALSTASASLAKAENAVAKLGLNGQVLSDARKHLNIALGHSGVTPAVQNANF